MDWPRARGVLIIAFFLVNLILAYSIWGPIGIFPELVGTPHQQQVQQVRATLASRGFNLTASVPETPGEMRFLRVEYEPTLVFYQLRNELFGRQHPSIRDVFPQPAGSLRVGPAGFETEAQTIFFQPQAAGDAAWNLKLDNPQLIQQETADYLKRHDLLPNNAVFSGIFKQSAAANPIVEFVPVYEQHPIFSGFVRTEVSERGIESITHYWVQPQGYKDAPAKAVRPAAEALLRLVGHLERKGTVRGTISEIRLGYYAGRTLTLSESGVINAWDTVPVWRISLDTGEVYYINAFNGELES